MPDVNGLDASFLIAFKSYFISLCTFQSVSQTQSADGTAVTGSPTNISGLVNIPCRKMPAFFTGTRSVAVEDKAEYVYDKNLYQLDLYGYYPQITPLMLCVVDGVLHRIIGPVGDGSKVKTDLRIELLTQ